MLNDIHGVSIKEQTRLGSPSIAGRIFECSNIFKRSPRRKMCHMPGIGGGAYMNRIKQKRVKHDKHANFLSLWRK